MAAERLIHPSYFAAARACLLAPPRVDADTNPRPLDPPANRSTDDRAS